MRNPERLFGFLCAAVFLLAASMTFSATPKRHVFSEPHMGTLVRITIYATDPIQAETAARKAFDRIAELNAIMSDYEPESELMRLCRQPARTPTSVSDDLFMILQRSLQVSELTGGAFDVTAGPVTRLWRQARRQERLPAPADLNNALKRVGYRNLRLDEATQTVTLLASDMQLDLGGIAKGYAADEALRMLRDSGLPRSLVAVSGDLAIGDPPPGEKGWRIGIASIDPTKSRVTDALTVANVAISTSGDTEQFIEIDGKRYSHIVDPRTGVGLTTRTGVTILAPDTTTADALATSVSVLGPEKGINLVESLPTVEALIVEHTDTGYRKIQSTGFPAD